MNTIDLLKCLKQNDVTRNYYGGIYASDTVTRPLKVPCYQIVNTDVSAGPGEHWIVLFYPSRKTVEFFDSLARTPFAYPRIYAYLKSLQADIVYNSPQIPLQNKKSETCGAHCVYFIYYKCKKRYGLQLIVKRYYTSDCDYNDCLALQLIKTKFAVLKQRLKQLHSTVAKRCF